jgi:hypothetical protein
MSQALEHVDQAGFSPVHIEAYIDVDWTSYELSAQRDIQGASNVIVPRFEIRD